MRSSQGLVLNTASLILAHVCGNRLTSRDREGADAQIQRTLFLACLPSHRGAPSSHARTAPAQVTVMR